MDARPLSEHVLPDEWPKHWPLPDGARIPADMRTELTQAQLSAVDQREGVKHSLGNLTLLTPPANSEGLNYDFGRKQQRLRTSLLAMNQDIADRKCWSEAEIAERAQRLADLAMKLWPAPSVT